MYLLLQKMSEANYCIMARQDNVILNKICLYWKNYHVKGRTKLGIILRVNITYRQTTTDKDNNIK